MNLEFIKLAVGFFIVVITVVIVYFRSGSKKSLDDFVISNLIKFWGKMVNFLIVLVLIWFAFKVGVELLRRII